MTFPRNCPYIVILFLLLVTSCSGVEKSQDVKVVDWQILFSQTEDYLVAYSSDKWESVDLSSTISLPYNKKSIYQYVWLKGHFSFDSFTDNFKGISFKYIPPVHRVYINDILIGEATYKEVRDLGGSRSYFIPPNLLKDGDNNILVRIGEYGKWGIEVNEEITINDPASFMRNRSFNNLVNEIIPMSVLVILVVSFLSFLLKGLLEKYNKEYLLLSLRILLIISCYLTFYSPISIFSVNVIEAVWSGVLPLFCICILYYSQIIYSLYFTRLNRVAISYLVIASVLIFIMKVADTGLVFSNLLLVLSVLISILFIFYIGLKIIKNRERNFKLLLLFFDTVIVMINIITVFIFITFNTYVLDPSILVIVSCIILTILYSIYFANRETLRQRDMISLTIKLREIEDKEKDSKKYNISPQVADKLDNIISFVKDNHSQSVTRDLLAETVGVSSNYLSSLFNIYTGKKINEFINDIRLDDASGKLSNCDLSITDIAFSSGFESLTTFNRLFKKKFGASPKEFRNKK